METPNRKIRFDTATAKLLSIVGRAKDAELLLQVKELVEAELRPIAFEIEEPKTKAKRKVGPDKSVLDDRDGRFLGDEE
jgi:hypothetical protein